MSARCKKAFSVLLLGAGIIWFNAAPIGNAIVWLADSFSLRDQLESINNPLQTFYLWLKSLDQTTHVFQYAPWFLAIGGTLLYMLVVISEYFARMFASIRAEKLAQACEDLANEIKEFLRSRESQEPRYSATDLTEDDFEEQLTAEADYASQTGILYGETINPKLNELFSMLTKNQHRPHENLIFGDENWANRKIGKLTSYARIIRKGEKIVDNQNNPGAG